MSSQGRGTHWLKYYIESEPLEFSQVRSHIAQCVKGQQLCGKREKYEHSHRNIQIYVVILEWQADWCWSIKGLLIEVGRIWNKKQFSSTCNSLWMLL